MTETIELGRIEAGSRYDLRVLGSPGAPDESELDEKDGAFGYVHSYETSSRYDGPGVRLVLFVSGCLLRCSYCHNPDTWHLKDGTHVSARHVIGRLEDFASKVHAGLDGLDWNGTREIVRAMVRRIEIDKDQVDIVFRVPPPPPGSDGDPRRSTRQEGHVWQDCRGGRGTAWRGSPPTPWSQAKEERQCQSGYRRPQPPGRAFMRPSSSARRTGSWRSLGRTGTSQAFTGSATAVLRIWSGSCVPPPAMVTVWSFATRPDMTASGWRGLAIRSSSALPEEARRANQLSYAWLTGEPRRQP